MGVLPALSDPRYLRASVPLFVGVPPGFGIRLGPSLADTRSVWRSPR